MSKNIINPFNKGGIMHKRSLLIYGLAVVVLIAVGSLVWYLNRSSADQADGGDKNKKYTVLILGTVTEEATSAPIENAEVKSWLFNDKSTIRGTTTDKQGKYSLMFRYPAGERSIEMSATKIGYQKGPGRAMLLENPKRVTVDFKLSRQGPDISSSIFGTVTLTTNGQPVAGATVMKGYTDMKCSEQIGSGSPFIDGSMTLRDGRYIIQTNPGNFCVAVMTPWSGSEIVDYRDIEVGEDSDVEVNFTVNPPTPPTGGGGSGTP